ncbi:cyclic nucleotide-binding domain-containing protein [Algihabitans albus]|uniref:cyclic nucleotide-binding domain-containing protein n=1 Tax=Algihabitans albus TaxID=2164067 RepID=UPI000E5D3A82|nr:cyclic nucleotide-binding domain-containing protein [Algihabitans albus]
MGLEQEVEVLRRIPLFANLEPARLKLMAFASERMTFKPDQALCREGDPGDAAYIIVDGKADILKDTVDGPVKVAEVGRNAIIGEIAILIDVPRTASVVATDELTALKITTDLFYRLLADFPEMGVEIMRVLARRLEETTDKLGEVEDRLRRAERG